MFIYIYLAVASIFVTSALQSSVAEQLMAQQIAQRNIASALTQIKTNRLTIVYCYSNRCVYCRYTRPLIDQLKQIYGSRVTFIEINVSDNMSAFKHSFHASTVPLIIYYKNGNEVSRHGSDNKTMTIERMKHIVESQLLG